MGTWHEAYWQSAHTGMGVSARMKRSGSYRWYCPDLLVGRSVVLTPELDLELGRVERRIRALTAGDVGDDLVGLGRLLVRSEAIASSKIEGIAPAARQAALAELAVTEDLKGVSASAELVARNMTLVRDATESLAGADAVTLDDIIDLHSSLLADEPRHHGLRTEQNWIGGSDHHPLEADFVPPHPDLVELLMRDLVDYLNGATHSPLVQAALVHAQFETIHPFTDGNGRMGRALIHTVLMRRGLTSSAVLPVSLVLATFSDSYVRGLTDYRYTDGDDDASQTALWIAEFVRAVDLAVDQAGGLRADIARLRNQWAELLEAQNERRRALRADSATALVLRELPRTPVLTSRTVQCRYGVSAPTALRALEELTAMGILERRTAGARLYVYTATEVLDLVTLAERRLASTKFDTRASGPIRPVPAWPSGS